MAQYGYNQQPGTYPPGGFSGQPAGGYPGQPAGGFPGQPAGGFPGQPAAGYSAPPTGYQGYAGENRVVFLLPPSLLSASSDFYMCMLRASKMIIALFSPVHRGPASWGEPHFLRLVYCCGHGSQRLHISDGTTKGPLKQ